jgi:hypothetical protein
MITRIVNIYKEPYDQYIGRAGKAQDGYFGDPFRLGSGESRGGSLEKFREYFYERVKTDPQYRTRVHQLKGITLGCFC